MKNYPFRYIVLVCLAVCHPSLWTERESKLTSRLEVKLVKTRRGVLARDLSDASTMSHATNAAGEIPPSARDISLILASTPGVSDAQPAVLLQLLEFAHRYTSQVLQDGLVYAEHAGRNNKLELDDVILAVQARVGWELGGRVPKEVCLQS